VNGGTETVSSGGTASNSVISSGGSLVVASGGLADPTTIYGGGSETISRGGTDLGAHISGGVQIASGLVSGATIFAGSQIVRSAGTAIGTIVSNGGTEFVSGGGRASGSVVASGGYELVSNGGIAVATKISGGTLEVASGGTASGVVFSGSGTLQLDPGSHLTGTISGFHSGGGIDIEGLAFNASSSTLSWTQKTSTSGVLTVKEGSQTQSFTLAGSYTVSNFSASSDGHGGTLITDPPVTSGGTVVGGAGTDGGRLMHLDSLLSQFAGVISGFNLGDQIGLPSLGFGSSSGAMPWMRETADAGASGVHKGGIFDLTLLAQYAVNFSGGTVGHDDTVLTNPTLTTASGSLPIIAPPSHG
jgi:autotransporter passenger strand-loop-strand repeat protein